MKDLSIVSGPMQPEFLEQFVFDRRFHFARHGAFWLLVLFGIIALHGASENDWGMSFVMSLAMAPLEMAFTYAVLFWLVPQYLVRKRFTRFCFYLFIAAILFQAALVVENHFIIIPFITGTSPSDINLDYSEYFDWFKSMVGFIVTAVAVLIKMVKYWYTEQQQKQLAEKEKITAELQLLKAQLHPHFLFNTLNNLYALVREQSDKAPNMLLRLSGLLSYVLYECKADEVLLTKEISVIRDYAALEQERYGDRLEVSLSFSGETEGRMIVPMLFQPFIENAFKHGVSEQTGTSWISVDLSVKKRRLVFKLVNSFEETSGTPVPGGIGILNIEKRLQLLYPGRHLLQYGLETGVYVVSMQIELNN